MKDLEKRVMAYLEIWEKIKDRRCEYYVSDIDFIVETCTAFLEQKKETQSLKDGWNTASKNHLHLYQENTDLKSQLLSARTERDEAIELIRKLSAIESDGYETNDQLDAMEFLNRIEKKEEKE